jgi:hypothetical protein
VSKTSADLKKGSKPKLKTSDEFQGLGAQIQVGKDILELLSSSMYVDPLTVYREYIQNAADSIDQAIELGVLNSHAESNIQIRLDHVGRRILIHDNGVGVSNDDFESRLTSFGASKKRGSSARGFRGVGRLSGLGYCQELIFRSRSAGDKFVKEIKWDCKKLKALLTDVNYDKDLNDLVQEVASVKEYKPVDMPAHFFEVEIIKPRRLGSDLLMSEERIKNYISEVGPVPLDPKFKFTAEINGYLESHNVALSEYPVYLNDGDDNQIYRPFQNKITYSDTREGECSEIEFISIDAIGGEPAAVGWIAHHDYQGAIPHSEKVRGLKARVGNIQIGGNRLFVDIYPEERFNSWTVGEVHLLDRKIVPNGRRDEFEQNNHFANLKSHLMPYVSSIARRCRNQSTIRNRMKTIEYGKLKIEEALEVIKTGAASKSYLKVIRNDAIFKLSELKKAAQYDLFSDNEKNNFLKKINLLENKIDAQLAEKRADAGKPDFSGSQKKIVDLIYQCSVNTTIADILVQRIRDALSKSK